MVKNFEKITCEICGKKFPTLTTHIIRTHHLSTAEYLKRFTGSTLSSIAYKEKVSRSAKNKFLQDPTMKQKVASRTFDFISNKNLAVLLKRDYKDAKICLQSSLWKPSIILYGSIIEAILLEKYPHSNFHDAINTAFNNKEISENEYHKIHVIRDLRNFVHLHKELSEEHEINEYWARTAADICESIIKRYK